MSNQKAENEEPIKLTDWIENEVIPFSIDSTASFNAAVAKMVAAMGDAIDILGLGEALHGGEDILILRNRLFQCLAETHGYTAIAIESSYPQARLVNEFVTGGGLISSEALQEVGFSHGFGRLTANRELVGWMRDYNAGPSHAIQLHFYGFDSPTEMMFADSPRQILHFVLDYLTSLDSASGQEHRQRIEALIGQDSDWENPAVAMDPSRGVGRSPNATALRVAVVDLITELHIHRPEFSAKSGAERYLEAMHYAAMARQLLTYHSVLAGTSKNRMIELLGMRDALMADNLAYIVSRERSRGKVLAFAHNSHLQRGRAQWQLGPDLLTWWPAGAHLNEIFGAGYAVIGTGVGVSEANGIGRPGDGTLEACLAAVPGPVRFIPTHRGQGLPVAEIAALPPRSRSTKNTTYFPLTPQSLTDFDWLAVLDSTDYSRGGPLLAG